MPIVRVSGLEGETDKTIRGTFPKIKIWVASVKRLDVGTEHVRPIYFEIIQEVPGECVIFEVLELFNESLAGTFRDAGIRKALCKSIEAGFNEFISTEKLNARPKEAVVIICTVDRSEWEFHHWDIPDKSPKDELPDDGHNFFGGVERGPRDPNR